MPRRIVPFLPNQYYHFYNRGNNRQAVFFERANYIYFLRGVKKYLCSRMDIVVYCLLPTHYHIVTRVKLPQDSSVLAIENSEALKAFSEGVAASKAVSLAMQKFGISYTKAINKRFDRVGSLFQGQFQGEPITNHNHLLNLCVYVHANPVKDGLVRLPEEWEFSNYLEWMNLREGTLVDRGFIAENFGTPEEYKKLITAYIESRKLPKDLQSYLQTLITLHN